MGFGTHPHDNMEIVTIVVDGALEHKDSMGNGEVLRPGEIQRMTAGTGITHSEFNPSPHEGTHLLQIWIHPAERGLEPSYEQRAIEPNGPLTLIVSPEGGNGAVKIHQDVRLYKGALKDGESANHTLAEGRGVWLQLIGGELTVNGETLAPGDGAAIENEPEIALTASKDAEFLLFDLA